MCINLVFNTNICCFITDLLFAEFWGYFGNFNEIGLSVIGLFLHFPNLIFCSFRGPTTFGNCKVEAVSVGTVAIVVALSGVL